jgi:hypothetical protein
MQTTMFICIFIAIFYTTLMTQIKFCRKIPIEVESYSHAEWRLAANYCKIIIIGILLYRLKIKDRSQYTSQLVNVNATKIVLYDEVNGLHFCQKFCQMGNPENL